MTTKIVKTKDAAWAYYWMTKVGGSSVPANVQSDGSVVSYDFVEGSLPSSWDAPHAAAMKYLWDAPGPKLSIDVREYTHYVAGRAAHQNVDVRRTLNYIDTYTGFTPVYTCHGDLTFENMVQTYKGDIVFIDPGHAHGLPCRELDRAKMMQSLEGWEVIAKGRPPLHLPDAPYPFSKIHYALLITHYVRLLAHWPQDRIQRWARGRISLLERREL